MPDTNLQNALRDCVAEVLEKMFFVEVLDGATDGYDSTPGKMAVKLTFEGSPSGSLTLNVDVTAARQIAADFLGEDEATLTDTQVGEVVCELANMVCGSLLSRVESCATFRLSQPRLLVADDWRYRPEDTEYRASHVVTIGSGTLTATVETREPVCQAVEKSAY